MLSWFRRILTAPQFGEDIQKTNAARYLQVLTWLTLGLLVVGLIALPLAAPQLISRLPALALLLALQPCLLWLVRRGNVKTSALLSVLAFWLMFAYGSAVSGGVRSVPFAGNLILILTASILLGQPTAIGFAAATIAQGWFLLWAENHGYLAPFATPPETAFLLQSLYLIVGASTLHYATYNIKTALDQAHRELTERQRVEQAKQDSENNLKALLNAYTDTAFLIDAHGKFIALNETVAKQFGHPTNELIGASAYALLNPGLAEERIAKIEEAIRTRQPVRFVDHGRDWNDNTIFPVLDANGNVTRLAIYARDIGDYKIAEQRLVESEQKFRNIVESSPMGTHLYQMQADGRLVLIVANPAADTILGVDHRPFIGKTIEEAFPGLCAGGLPEFFHRVCATGNPWHTEQIDLAGPYFHGTFEFHAFQTAPGLMAALFVDVTARKRAAEALRASEERYRVISELISDYAYAYEVTPDKTLTTAWITEDSFTRLTGYAWSEIGATYKLYHPDDAALANQHVTVTLAGQDTPGEYRILTKGGELKWLAIRRRGQWDARAQRVIRMYGAAQDITERKRAEADREALIKELETKNAELERFTYTVSHDLKSPLITIQGFVGFVEQDALAGNVERLKTDIARITEATKKMTQLLNELLELSRIGRLMNPPEEVSFSDIARDAIELVRGRLNANNIQVTVAEPLPVVHGDRARLVEVMQNLIDNAAKFIGDQPHPRIAIGFKGSGVDGKSIFFVRDNGIGIERKYHERIFGLFNKLDARSEGTGVGLALVKRIIEVHGGKIWVESEGAGKGATFCFTLPIKSTS